MKDIRVLDNDVIHVNGVELVEVFGERDEVDGGAFVELVEVGVASVVPLPPQIPQDLVE